MSSYGATYTHVPCDGHIRTLPERHFIYMSGTGASLWNHWPQHRLKKWARKGWRTIVRPARWEREENPPDWVAEMERTEKQTIAREVSDAIRSIAPFPRCEPAVDRPCTWTFGRINSFKLWTG